MGYHKLGTCCNCALTQAGGGGGPAASNHDWTAVVTHCGRLCFDRRKINVSQVFAGQQVGVRQVTERIWLVSFYGLQLRVF